MDRYDRMKGLAAVHVRKRPRISDKSRALRDSEGERKARRAKRCSTKSAGKLALFKDLPLDVVYEICSHLHPIDLLQLSRVSKDFRATFNNKSFRSLWIVARRALNVPDPLPPISEPRYAATLFEHNCFACGVGRSMKMHHAASLRFCAACWKANMMKGRRLLKEYSSQDLDERICQLVPRLMTIDMTARPEQHSADDVYYAPDFEAECQKWHTLQDEDGKEEYLDERYDYVEDASVFAWNLMEWDEDQKEERQEEADEAQKKRECSISEKLVELGYDPEEDFPPKCWNSEWRSAVVQPRELTPQIWKRIRPILEQAIQDWRLDKEEGFRNGRQRERRLEIMLAYVEYLERVPLEDGPYPTQFELITLPVVDELVEEEDATLPLTKERWIRVEDFLSEFKSTAKIAMVGALIDAWVATGRQTAALDGDDTDSILEHATALFTCPFCPFVAGPINSKIPTANVYHIGELNAHVRVLHRFGMDCGRLNAVAHVADASDILLAAGVSNPESAKYDEISKRVVCKCDDPTLEQPATFSEVVSHIRLEKMYYEEYQANFRLSLRPHSHESPDIHLDYKPCLRFDPESDLHPDHSLAAPNPCVTMIAAGQAPPPLRVLTPAEQHVLDTVDVHPYYVCAPCWAAIRTHYEVMDRFRGVVVHIGVPCPPIFRHRAEAIVRHVKNKLSAIWFVDCMVGTYGIGRARHGREAVVEDLMPFGSDPLHCRYWEPLPERE